MVSLTSNAPVQSPGQPPAGRDAAQQGLTSAQRYQQMHQAISRRTALKAVESWTRLGHHQRAEQVRADYEREFNEPLEAATS